MSHRPVRMLDKPVWDIRQDSLGYQTGQFRMSDRPVRMSDRPVRMSDRPV